MYKDKFETIENLSSLLRINVLFLNREYDEGSLEDIIKTNFFKNKSTLDTIFTSSGSYLYYHYQDYGAIFYSELHRQDGIGTNEIIERIQKIIVSYSQREMLGYL